MSVFTMTLPDVGEGVAEAELIDWLVALGDEVTPDSAIAEVMTDKATIEISAPVSGVVVELHGVPGDMLTVGSSFVAIRTETGAETGAETAPVEAVVAAPAPERIGRAGVTAAPAVRARAAQLDIDLHTVAGSGPQGRVVHADLDRLLADGDGARSGPSTDGPRAPQVQPVRGLRRQISRRLTATWQEIPHITYVEAVDVTALDDLRATMNRGLADSAGPADAPDSAEPRRARLTLLPFLIRAMVVACRDQPQLNAHHDAAAETLTVFDAVDVGIATQTANGLVVPVVRQAGGRDLWDLAAEIKRVSTAARENRSGAAVLSGSTITITSLGALGGLVTTPILNAPEVAIVGVNKVEVRPVWRDGAFQPRRMMNLSSSFDHRVVDGWDGATFIQRIRGLLEQPALLFTEP